MKRSPISPIITSSTDQPRRLAKVGIQNSIPGGGPGLSPYARTYREQMLKKADNFGSMGNLGPGTGGANVLTSSPEIRNPLLNLINFYLPYDRKTLNQWIRYYDRFQPYIGNGIDIHAEFPISDFHFTGISDPKIQQLYDDQKEAANLVEFSYEASREYELIGEVFSFWRWDDDDGMFGNYVIINPDLLELKTVDWGYGRKTIYQYDPPEELKEMFRNRDDQTNELLDELDDVVYENIAANKKIPLDDFNMMALVRRASPYESRGTSIVLRCIKELMYEDKLREAQYATADQQITPVQIWKLGDPASNYMPSDEDLAEFRALILAGRNDPLFSIVSHGAVNLDLVGYTGKLLPVIPEYEWVAKRVMVALFTNEAMMGSNGPTYGNAVVALKVLQGRYQLKRDKLRKAFRDKIFKPVALAHGAYETTPANLAHGVRTVPKTGLNSGKRKLQIPGIEWNFKLDLTDQAQRIQYLMSLRDKVGIPFKTVAEVLDLDYDSIKSLLRTEEGTTLDPVYQAQRAKNGGKVGGSGGSSAPPASGDAGGDSGADESADTTEDMEAPTPEDVPE